MMEAVRFRRLNCSRAIETSAKKDVHDTHNAASGLSLATDGKHLFCTTAGEDTVSMFERDEETGTADKEVYTSDQW